VATNAGSPGDIPAGSFKGVEVYGDAVLVSNIGGTFYAVSDICTHLQCNLSDGGELSGTTITCECHGSGFNVTNGEVVNGPARNPLKVFTVQVSGNEVQVSA
jgi:nitrite reductase/ring-hydroxylating ferredoxin subunit